MTKIAALAAAFAVAFAPVVYAADKADGMSAEAPKTAKECKKAKGMKWDKKAKACVAKKTKK